MTTFRQIQDEVLQTLYGYGLDQPRATFLTAGISDTDLQLTVIDTTSVGQGVAEIEGELVFIDSVDRSSNIITLAPDGRGFFGTTAAAHAQDARVTIAPVWPRNRVKGAINDIITSVHPTLFGVAQAQFAFNPTTTTYALPAEAERVLSVTADVNGPSREQHIIRHYSFSSVAPTDDWATTNTLTLHEAVSPGRTVTVTYLKQPTALAADGDALSTSGLAETAKLAIVYGSCAQLLSFMDVSRIPVDTARADEYAEKNQLGMASRIAGQLQLKHDLELEKERKRQRQRYPVPITMRKR